MVVQTGAWGAWALCTCLCCRLPDACLPVKKPFLLLLIVALSTLYTNQPFRICPTTRYICYIVAFFCRLYSVPSLVKVDKAIKMAPYGRAGSGLPMPCTVPRLPGLIHCVQLLTLLLPLAQWSDYNKAPLCRLPVMIPSSPTCPPTKYSEMVQKEKVR